MPDDEYAERVLPVPREARDRPAVDGRSCAARSPRVRERAHTFVEAADALDFFFRDEPVMDEKAAKKFLVPGGRAAPRGLAAALAARTTWTADGARGRASTRGSRKGLQSRTSRSRRASRSPGARRARASTRCSWSSARDASLARLDAAAPRHRGGALELRARLRRSSTGVRLAAPLPSPRVDRSGCVERRSRSSPSRRCSSSCRSSGSSSGRRGASSTRTRTGTAASSLAQGKSDHAPVRRDGHGRRRSSRCRSTTAAAASSTRTIRPLLDRASTTRIHGKIFGDRQVRRALRLRLVGVHAHLRLRRPVRASGSSSSRKDSLLDFGLRTKRLLQARVDLPPVPRRSCSRRCSS